MPYASPERQRAANRDAMRRYRERQRQQHQAIRDTPPTPRYTHQPAGQSESEPDTWIEAAAALEAPPSVPKPEPEPEPAPVVSEPELLPLPTLPHPARGARAPELIAWLRASGWSMRDIAAVLPADELGRFTSSSTLYSILTGRYSGEQVKHRLRWLVDTRGVGDYIPPPPPAPRRVQPIRRTVRQRDSRKRSGGRQSARSNTSTTPAAPAPPPRKPLWRRLLGMGIKAGGATLGLAIVGAVLQSRHERPSGREAYPPVRSVAPARADPAAAPPVPPLPIVNLAEQWSEQWEEAARRSQRGYTPPPEWALRVPPPAPPPSMTRPTPGPRPGRLPAVHGHATRTTRHKGRGRGFRP